MMRWVPSTNTDVNHYNVYKSFIGFVAPIVSLDGLELKLKLNGGKLQTVLFSAGDIVAQVNAAISGGQAYVSQADNSKFIFRSNVRVAPGSVEIVGGTALSALGLTAKTIYETSDPYLYDQALSPVDPADSVEYTDADEDIYDLYANAPVSSLAVVGKMTSFSRPVSSTVPVCIVTGVLTDVQGIPVPDMTVTAVAQDTPESTALVSGITNQTVSTQSDSDGVFNLILMQGALVRLEIYGIKLGRMVTVPEQDFVQLNDLLTDLDYQYPLGYRGSR